MVPKTLPDADYLRTCFTYDPDTGILRWRHRPRDHFPSALGWKIFNGRCAGRPAGTPTERGYLKCKIDDVRYFVHRIAWAHVYGNWPDDQIDHINCNGSDNRIVNLRLASNSENKCNSVIRADNTSGFKGVSWDKEAGKWVAQIRINNRLYKLGRFAIPEDAHAAYCRAAERLHGKFARTS